VKREKKLPLQEQGIAIQLSRPRRLTVKLIGLGNATSPDRPLFQPAKGLKAAWFCRALDNIGSRKEWKVRRFAAIG